VKIGPDLTNPESMLLLGAAGLAGVERTALRPRSATTGLLGSCVREKVSGPDSDFVLTHIHRSS